MPYGLNLLVLYLGLRGSFLATLVFPFHQEPTIKVYLIWRTLKQSPHRWSRNIKNDTVIQKHFQHNVVQLIVKAKSQLR